MSSAPALTKRPAARKRNRKRKRRAASTDSSDSSSSDSSSESESDSAPKKTKAIVPAKPIPESSDSSSSSSDSSSDSDSDEPPQKAPLVVPVTPKVAPPSPKKRNSPSPSPPPAEIPSFIPSTSTPNTTVIPDTINQEQIMKEKFRKFWMTSVADGFKDDLEQIRKEPNLGTSRLALLIDSLASGGDVFTSSSESNDINEMDVVLGSI